MLSEGGNKNHSLPTPQRGVPRVFVEMKGRSGAFVPHVKLSITQMERRSFGARHMLPGGGTMCLTSSNAACRRRILVINYNTCNTNRRNRNTNRRNRNTNYMKLHIYRTKTRKGDCNTDRNTDHNNLCHPRLCWYRHLSADHSVPNHLRLCCHNINHTNKYLNHVPN